MYVYEIARTCNGVLDESERQQLRRLRLHVFRQRGELRAGVATHDPGHQDTDALENAQENTTSNCRTESRPRTT